MIGETSFRVRPALSNTERQRRFRERNPGYYGRLHRARKAIVDANIEAQRIKALAANPVLALPAPTQLLLPAPAEQFTLFDFLDAQRDRELITIAATETTAA